MIDWDDVEIHLHEFLGLSTVMLRHQPTGIWVVEGPSFSLVKAKHRAFRRLCDAVQKAGDDPVQNRG